MNDLIANNILSIYIKFRDINFYGVQSKYFRKKDFSKNYAGLSV